MRQVETWRANAVQYEDQAHVVYVIFCQIPINSFR